MARLQKLVALALLGVVSLAPVCGEELDAAAVADLCRCLQSPQTDVQRLANARLVALGDQGVVALLAALGDPSRATATGAQAGLNSLAQHYARPEAERKRRASFVALLARYLAGDGSKASKEAVIGALHTCGGKDTIPPLAECLLHDELASRASNALAHTPHPEALKALREALPRLQGASCVSVMVALAERHDPLATPLFVAQLQARDEATRIAAMHSLQKIGGPQAVSALAAVLEQGSDAERGAALQAYLALGWQLAEAKQDSEALKIYLTALKAGPPEGTKCTVLRYIARLGSAGDVPAVAAFLADPSPAVEEAARQCLVGMRDPKVPEALAEAMKTTSPSERAGLLRVLAERQEPAATEAIEAATKDPSPEVRLSALRLLGRLASAEAEEALRTIAQTGSASARADAAEACLLIGDARWKTAQDGPLAAYAQALDLATNEELRNRALNSLAAFSRAKPPSEAKLPRVTDATRNDALSAYVGVACRLADSGQRERALEMLRRALDMGVPREVAATAVGKLRELGVDIDPARAGGFVTTWWVMGPFPGRLISARHPPENRVDLGEKIEADGRELTWTKHRTYDPSGVVDLSSLMKPDRDVTAYLYAEVTVDREQAAVLKTGSDDNEKIWLNDQSVFEFGGQRSLSIDGDRVQVSLAAGANRILVKVGNDSLGWLVCLRLTTTDNKPLQFIQKEN